MSCAATGHEERRCNSTFTKQGNTQVDFSTEVRNSGARPRALKEIWRTKTSNDTWPQLHLSNVVQSDSRREGFRAAFSLNCIYRMSILINATHQLVAVVSLSHQTKEKKKKKQRPIVNDTNSLKRVSANTQQFKKKTRRSVVFGKLEWECSRFPLYAWLFVKLCVRIERKPH